MVPSGHDEDDIDDELQEAVEKHFAQLDALREQALSLPESTLNPAERETLELYQSMGDKHFFRLRPDIRLEGWIFELLPNAIIYADSGPMSSDDLSLIPIAKVDLTCASHRFDGEDEVFRREDWVPLVFIREENQLQTVEMKLDAANIRTGLTETPSVTVWVRKTQIDAARRALAS